ncbi:MAG: TIGR04255 family protein [bacterium]|nr:TIGR04255 family protein [bacterium]
MERKYAKPPIVEAVCEFRLTGDTQWDPTIPGLVYEIIRDDFPKKELKVVRDIDITQTKEGLRQEVRTTERAWFLAEDGKTFVQIGPHLLAVNYLNPYPGWATFTPVIEKGLRALVATLDVKGLERIGLRYINRIEIPGPSVNLEQHFAFRPFLGNGLPQNMNGFVLSCLLPFADGRDLCRLGLTTAAPDRPDMAPFILDLDYFLAKPRTISVTQALEWVEAGHQKVVDVFEGCITDRLRETFEELR